MTATDRLSATDVSFLAAEDGRPGSHAHIGALMVFDGPAPDAEQLAAHVDAGLPLVPRYRQRLTYPPAGLGRPLWVDATDFRLDYHLRRTAARERSPDECHATAGPSGFHRQLRPPARRRAGRRRRGGHRHGRAGPRRPARLGRDRAG